MVYLNYHSDHITNIYKVHYWRCIVHGLRFCFFPTLTDISGEFIYSDASRQRIVFDMNARIPANSEVTMAELKLYKIAQRKHSMKEKKNHRPVNNARVSIYWVDVVENGSNRTSVVDSR